jgi:hypothetical protein
VKVASLVVSESDSMKRDIGNETIGLTEMAGLEELQRRAEELAQLGRETSDARLRSILLCLSREFREEAEHNVAMAEPDHQLSHFVPRHDET